MTSAEEVQWIYARFCFFNGSPQHALNSKSNHKSLIALDNLYYVTDERKTDQGHNDAATKRISAKPLSQKMSLQSHLAYYLD